MINKHILNNLKYIIPVDFFPRSSSCLSWQYFTGKPKTRLLLDEVYRQDITNTVVHNNSKCVTTERVTFSSVKLLQLHAAGQHHSK